MGYGELFAWTVVAIGVAIAGGTAAALRQRRRTGRFPGQPEDTTANDDAAVRGAKVRVALGVAVAVLGVAAVLAVRAA